MILRTCSLLAVLTLSFPAVAQDWPSWRGPGFDGALREADLLPPSFGLRLGWSRPLGAGYSGIVAADGAAVTMFSDGKTDFVAAFELADGRERWRIELGPTYEGRHGSEDGPSSTPCIAGGRVFAPGPHGRFVAVDLATGGVAWEVDLVEEHGVRVPWYGFGASPIAAGRVVFLPVGTRSGTAGLAFDRETGERLWSLAGAWVDYQPALRLGDGTLLVVDAVNLSVVDAATGEIRARVEHRPGERDMGYPQAVPVGPDRLLLVYQDGSALFSFDPGAERPLVEQWRSRELKDSYIAPVVHGQTVYGLSGVFLVAVDLATGERRWKSREPGARGLILVDGRLVLFATDGAVVLADASPEGYREVARVSAVERGGYSAPIFAGGRILVRNTEAIGSVEIATAGHRAESADSRERLPPGMLGRLVQRLRAAPDPEKVLAAWWSEQERFPIVENGSLVHFVWRGPARDVALLGDMAPDRAVPISMERIPGTDVFHRSFEYRPDGVWQYTFLVDADRVEPDPLNPERAPAVSTIAGNPLNFGYETPAVEAVLRMPEAAAPRFLIRDVKAPGRLETFGFAPADNRFLSTPRDVTVWLPPGYRPDGPALPVLYVIGGDLWFEHGHLKKALDNLIGARVAPAIVVSVPYHSGSRDRLDPDEYATFLAEQLVPQVEQRYRTRQGAAVLGVSSDAAVALTAGFKFPDRFPRVAAQSPDVDPEEFVILREAAGKPERVYLEWSAWEPRILDENTDNLAAARDVHAFLKGRDVEVVGGEVAAGPGWPSWSSRLDRALSAVLPPRSPAR